MDQQGQRGRSPSAGHQPNHISHSPSPGPYQPNDPSIGLGVGLDQHSYAGDAFGNGSNNLNGANSYLNPQQQQAAFGQHNVSDSTLYDPNANYNQQLPVSGADPSLSFNSSQSQADYLSPNLNDGDFSLFPTSSGQGDNYNTPLFEQTLNPNDMNNMTSPQPQHSPTPPHLLQPDGHQPGSAHQSPSFNQHQFSSPPGAQHSRNSSLAPESALMPNQLGDWTQPQFQGHRRSPSAHSDVSSVSPSPNLISADSFDIDHAGHSPLQRPSDGSLYQDVLGIESFTISDPPYSHGRSPSHSPAISPRIAPESLASGKPSGGYMPIPGGTYGDPSTIPNMQVTSEAFPNLGVTSDQSQMAPPSINIDYAPTNAKPIAFGGIKSEIDQDSLTPPERGRQRAARPRAVTDPFHPGGGAFSRSSHSPSPSPSLGSDLGPRSEASRSLSPFDRDSGTSPTRRRQSTSAVPNNVIALRLADPENHTGQDAGSTKRAQKHPATFQCTLCPKRFTRAYNLRSHLRTHTDERPFVCTVCGKAFARQHDRKRHESLHSGEKKFVCKGDLKAGGQWGCGRRFARADALGRHFRSEAGRICIKPLLDEEMLERQRLWQEQRMQQNVNMAPAPVIDPATGFPMDPSGQYSLPAALLAQYPALAQMNWSGPDMSGGLDDELSGRSSFDASDFDDGDDGGYVSGPGTGYGEGGMGQNFGEMGYTSDFAGR